LLGRKILSCIHVGKGPNKVGFVDIFSHLEMLSNYFLSSLFSFIF
jgi:hypothetical protein